MGKLMLLLYFILSVFPADAMENRRHIHVVRRGSKKSHRGDTVAMRNSMTNCYLSSFAYAANINLNNHTLTAQEAKTTLPTGTYYGLRYSFDVSRRTLTVTKAN